MNPKPIVATKKSIKIQVSKGETYFWCACGKSQNQPFCDGSHTGTPFEPLPYLATEDKIVGFCGCKYTQIPPLCDGAHKCLPDDAE